MRRILFISPQPFFEWRGSPIRVGFDLQALGELGYRVDFLTLPHGQPRDIPGVRMIRVPNVFFVRSVPIGPSAVKLAFDAVLLLWAFCLCVRHRYAAVHCVEDAGIIGVLTAWLRRSCLVFEKHSDPSSYRKGRLRNLVMAVYAAVERLTIRCAHVVIGTGPGLVEQARQVSTRAQVHHIFDIPSSLVEPSPERTAAVRQELVQSGDKWVVTYVGSFAVYQGVDLMFEAIPAAVKACPEARFVIIGGTAEDIEERTRRLREAGVDGNVTFPGRVPPDTLPDYLAASDVLMSPRQAGVNTPLKLLDYLKAGSAIVATDTEANRLILSEDVSLLVDAQPGAFAEGIVRLLRDDGLRTGLAAEGRKLIDTRYNFAEFKRRLAAAYEHALGGGE